MNCITYNNINHDRKKDNEEGGSRNSYISRGNKNKRCKSIDIFKGLKGKMRNRLERRIGIV